MNWDTHKQQQTYVTPPYSTNDEMTLMKWGYMTFDKKTTVIRFQKNGVAVTILENNGKSWK